MDCSSAVANGPGRRFLAQVCTGHRLGVWLENASGVDWRVINALPRFQRDGAVRILEILSRSHGALLADAVGLGKTHVAAAVVASAPSRFPRVLLIAPAQLLPHWRRILKVPPGQRVEWISFTRLSQQRGALERRDLRADDTSVAVNSTYDLIVVDEAHRLRHRRTLRHRAVAGLAQAGQLLLVSATPLQNAVADFQCLLGLLDIGAPSRPQPSTHQITQSLERVMVRRDRPTLRLLYPDDCYGAVPLDGGPTITNRTVEYSLAKPMLACLRELAALVRQLTPDVDKAGTRVLIRRVLLKRAESSLDAFVATLVRLRNYLDRAAEAQRCGSSLSRQEFRTLFGHDCTGQVAQYVLPFLFGGDTGSNIDFETALVVVDRTVSQLRSLLNNGADPKFQLLTQLLDENSQKPDNADNTVVMSCFRDTAIGLFERLQGRGVALLTGEGAWVEGRGPVARGALLRHFGPHGPVFPSTLELLVASDVLSEGVSLSRVQRIVHYDTPFNPVRLDQRVGRLQRLDSRHAVAESIRLLPPKHIEDELRLLEMLAVKTVIREQFFPSPIPALSTRPVTYDGFQLDDVFAAHLDQANGSGPCGVRLPGRTDGWVLVYQIQLAVFGEPRPTLFWFRPEHPVQAPADAEIANWLLAAPGAPAAPGPPSRIRLLGASAAARAAGVALLRELSPIPSLLGGAAEKQEQAKRARLAYLNGDLAGLQDSERELQQRRSSPPLVQLTRSDYRKQGPGPAFSETRLLGWIQLIAGTPNHSVGVL